MTHSERIERIARPGMRDLAVVRRELAAARDRYRLSGPTHQAVADCERLYAEERAMIDAAIKEAE